MNTTPPHLAESQKLRIRTELAKAMNIQACDQWQCVASGLLGSAYEKHCDHSNCRAPEFFPPDPFNSLADNKALVEWMGAQSGYNAFSCFTDDLFHRLGIGMTDGPEVILTRVELAMLMAADCESITLAAAKALGIGDAK